MKITKLFLDDQIHTLSGFYYSFIFSTSNGNVSGFDISRPIAPYSDNQPGAFGLVDAHAEPFRYGKTEKEVLDTRMGASVNCEVLMFCSHANGTHTECVGHIVNERIFVGSCPIPMLIPALVISVKPQIQQDGDFVISESSVIGQCEKWPLDQLIGLRGGALVVRVLTKEANLRFFNTNPPYFEPSATKYMCDTLQVMHLVVDLPSVDKEDSGKLMPNHSIFFGLKPGCKSFVKATRPMATITELANIHQAVTDGSYMLAINVAPIEMESAPSRLILFPTPRKSLTDILCFAIREIAHVLIRLVYGLFS